MIKKAPEITLKVRPIALAIEHRYYYEGPCRFGKGEELQPGFDRLLMGQIAEDFLGDEYMLHQMSYTTEREDFSDLTDEEFANFREVCAGGIGKGRLYRFASPIDPKYSRNTYADAAIRKAGVKPGDDKYELIVKNLNSNLGKAFGITDVAGADLCAVATEYVKSLGLTDEELDALKSNLSGGEPKLPVENPSEAADSTYTVAPGDTLRKIALKQLGDSERWAQIYELNRDRIQNPDLIFIGQELKVS